MPFDLSAGPADVRRHLHHALGSWPFGHHAHTSRTDLLSNFLLYVPLGVMLAARLRLGARAGRWSAVLLAAGAASSLSFCVEAVQLLSWTRIASAQDWLLNTIGGGSGAVAGAVFGRATVLRVLRRVRTGFARRPLAPVAGVLLVMLAADGLFPYLPTLDISQLKRGVRASHAAIGPGLAEHPWHHWLVRRGVAFAALAAALGAARRPGKPRRWLGAAVVAGVVATGLEACKPFIVSRSANVGNVLVAWAGAAVGALAGRLLARRLSVRAGAALAAALLTLYLAYLECEPFQFQWDAAAAQQKVPTGAKWLPLYHYAMGARAEDVRLFARTLLLTAGLAVAVLLARGRDARRRVLLLSAVGTGALGLGLELLQFLLPGRVPSTTDVLTFALGGAVGAWVYRRIAQRSHAGSGAPSGYNPLHGA